MNNIKVAIFSETLQDYLCTHFPVTIVPKGRYAEADYIIADTFSDALYKFKGVRILYRGENHKIDLNTFDYCITHEYRNDDRCLRFPYWLTHMLRFRNLRPYLLGERPKVTPEELKDKQTEFCAFICKNPKGKQRNSLVKNLNLKRKVNCAGPFMNNVGFTLPRDYESKHEYQKKHCFSIAYENECGEGYQTEKIIDAFVSGSIPIYWGNKDVAKEFNPAAFVHARDFRTEQELIDYLLQLADDPERRAEMINAEILQDNEVFSKSDKALFDFFSKIFERGSGAIQRTRMQRFLGFTQQFYGHGLFRTLRHISRKLRGKYNPETV